MSEVELVVAAKPVSVVAAAVLVKPVVAAVVWADTEEASANSRQRSAESGKLMKEDFVMVVLVV